MKILGIETSCDDTGVAIYDSVDGLLGHQLASQVAIHKLFGGVVPELAARDHIQKTLPLIKAVLAESKLDKAELSAIAYTAGPGLIGPLLVGSTVAKSLAMALGIPTIGVHHMEAHLLSPMLSNKTPEYPFVSLLVSGGHTMLVFVKSPGRYELLGETRDDAVGEAFDKFAKVLGLPYPGGPSIQSRATKGNPQRFRFTRPMIHHNSLEFSFSGLKTSAALSASKLDLDEQTVADLAHAFQDAAIDTLVTKSMLALKHCDSSALVVAGGVGANLLLRECMVLEANKINAEVFFPDMEFCMDNGAMIAYAGCLRFLSGQQDSLSYSVHPRWPLSSLPSIDNI